MVRLQGMVNKNEPKFNPEYLQQFERLITNAYKFGRKLASSISRGRGMHSASRPRNKSLQCLLVNLLALVEVDGTPGVAIEAGVKEA